MKTSKNQLIKRCPKSGKIVGINYDTFFGKVLYPFASIVAIVWFLFRVVPKPDRIAYPCQKFALSLGGTFLTYLSTLVISFGVFDKLRKNHRRLAYVSVFVFVFMGASAVIYALTDNPPNYKPILTNIEGANNPMGTERGIFPGRVVWVQDTDATSWDGENGFWWDDNNTDQQVTDKMFADAMVNLTGADNKAQAWNKLFLKHNAQNGKQKGYEPGEKVVIKVNLNPAGNSKAEWTDKGYSSPHMVNALVKELIEVAGVKGEDIVVTDPSRFFVGPIYEKIRSNPSEEFRKVCFIGREALDMPQQFAAKPDTTNNIFFDMPDGTELRMCLPQCFSDATYIVDYAVVRPHRVFGITNVAKNHFGSVWSYEKNAFHPGQLHAFALWDYPTPNKHKDAHSNPVLLGHNTMNSKTMLYLADGLYAAFNQSGNVERMSTMNNDWMSSLFVSMDPVALESVCYDFICSEPNLTQNNPSFNGHQDSQLHEAAMANNPPSGASYDPENDGTALTSLGVHEHWNNAQEKLYSRNMGKNHGIELVAVLK